MSREPFGMGEKLNPRKGAMASPGPVAAERIGEGLVGA
jgi:hypothetical protein